MNQRLNGSPLGGSTLMKRIVVFLSLTAVGVWAQSASDNKVIKDGFGPVFFLRFSPSGAELARVCAFGLPMLFDTAGYGKARTFSIGMRMVAYSPDGTMIVTAEGTDGVRVWDASIPGQRIPNVADSVFLLDRPLHILAPPSRDPMQRAFWTEFSPDGKHLITTHANGHVKVWNTGSWAVEEDLYLTTTEVRAAAFLPDGKSFMIGDIYGGLHQWSLETKTEIKAMPGPNYGGAITGLVFSPDGRKLVTTHQGEKGNVVMIWDTAGWTARIVSGFSSAAFSRDGKLLALGGNQILLIDPARVQDIRTIELPQLSMREASSRAQTQPNADQKVPIQLGALAFSPDGRTLAAGSADGTVRLVPMTP